MQTVRAKKHRLPAAAYVGRKTVAFTACVEQRKALFVEAELVESCVHLLDHWTRAHDCLVPVYCFMPDHLHVLIQGQADASRPKAAMDEFKYATGLLPAKSAVGAWQTDYHDQIIRRSDDWRRQAFYILNNPVRAGLAEDPYAYPFTGSLGFELQEMFFDLNW